MGKSYKEGYPSSVLINDSSLVIYKGLFNWYINQDFFRSRITGSHDFFILFFIQNTIDFSLEQHEEDKLSFIITESLLINKLNCKSIKFKSLLNKYYEVSFKSNREMKLANGYRLKEKYYKEIYEYVILDFNKNKRMNYIEISRNLVEKKKRYVSSNGKFYYLKKDAEDKDIDIKLENSEKYIFKPKKKSKVLKPLKYIAKGYRKEKVSINKNHLQNILENSLFKTFQEALLYLSILIKYEEFPFVVYKIGNTGRLNTVTNINGKQHKVLVNYQGIKKAFRKNIFKGFYEYDISTSAPTILNQIYKKEIGEELEYIDYYIKNKTKLRNYWANCFLEDEDSKNAEKNKIKRIKSLLTALFFGAKITNKDMIGKDVKKIFHKKYSLEEYLNLFNDEEFKQLVEEVNILFNELSKKYVKVRKNSKYCEIENAMGINKRFKRSEKNKAISHLYQGIEVKILLYIFESKKDSIALMIHDAIITDKKLELDELSKLAFECSNYNVIYEESIF